MYNKLKECETRKKPIRLVRNHDNAASPFVSFCMFQ